MYTGYQNVNGTKTKTSQINNKNHYKINIKIEKNNHYNVTNQNTLSINRISLANKLFYSRKDLYYEKKKSIHDYDCPCHNGLW